MGKRNLWKFKYFDSLKQSHRKPGLDSGSLKKRHRLEAEFRQYSYLPGKDIILGAGQNLGNCGWGGVRGGRSADARNIIFQNESSNFT